ncbi:MAG: phage tail tape measure protein [Ruminococcus sp.]|nr:phage tail tape measure protein [Ruminococcus sp.]
MALDGYLTFGTKLDDSGVKDGLEKLDKTVDGYSIGKNIFSNLATDAIKAAGGALVDAAKAGIDFEASMSKVQAVSGATGKQLESLTNLAREYGASTVFSSSECAEALNYMGMAGWTAEQMTSGLPGVLNLAAASGEDLGTTSDIVTDALTAFGMKAEEAGHFADILATASSRSNTNVSMMGETFKYVAPVAGALGYSAEDVAVAVGLMANNGIKASQAGTSLRTMLSNLAEPTDKQAAAMDVLGISLTDSSDKMKTLDALLGDIRGSFSGLDEASKASYASILAGSEGMSGLLAIVIVKKLEKQSVWYHTKNEINEHNHE